ncbi:MAG: HNH endonuclease [Zoogloeaceae bacterium]|jgi:hypothetical protein|nr:HNH endonuclease [Zoogloeaceae bacterium]
METNILAVDRAYTPDRWIGLPDAMRLYGRGAVQASFGNIAAVLRGGVNARTGRKSILEVRSILVVDTQDFLVRDFSYAPLERVYLFRRDRNMCAYCGEVFKFQELTVEHIAPVAQGGGNTWENWVTACRHCNQKKGCRTPEQANMPLLYVPYRPSRFEWLILANRNVLGCQMEFLMARVPRHSRLHA